MSVTVGYKGQVLVTGSPSVSATNVALIDSGDHQTYNISTASTQRYWDQTQLANFVLATSPDGTTWTPQAASSYTVTKFVNGQVKFNTANAAGTQVRMNTVYYFTYSTLVDAHSWELTLDDAEQDVTTFNTAGWKNYLSTIQGGSIKIARFWADSMFLPLIGNLMVAVLYPDSTSLNRYEMYAFIKQDQIKNSVDKVIEQDISLDVNGAIYYMTT